MNSDSGSTVDTERGWPVRARAVEAGAIDRFVLLVGISEYAHPQLKLRFAAEDASSLKVALLNAATGNFRQDHVLDLIDKNATLRNLNKALRTFLKKPGKDDLVILFFACHGSRDPERPDNLYLLPDDADPADISGTGLPMRDVDLALRETLLSRRVVILVDACHSAGIGDAFSGLRAAGDTAKEFDAYLAALSESRGGVSLMTSGMANESSVEGEQWGTGHGVFTHFLLEGLLGKADQPPFEGIVTVGELFDYVSQRVKEGTEGRQHPHISAGANRAFPLAATGMSATEHLELADGLAEAAEIIDEPGCWSGAAAQYAEAYKRGARSPTRSILVEHAKALFRAGARAESERVLLALPPETPHACRTLGLVQLALGKTNEARASLLQGNPIEPWAERLLDVRDGLRKKRVALLIALDSVSPTEFGGWTGQLVSPVKEARALGKLLETEFGFDQQISLFDAEATKSGILDRLAEVVNESSSFESLVVSFSGHGSQVPDPAVKSGLDSTLVAFDGQISSLEFDALLRKSVAGRTTLIASASHTGLFVDRAREGGYEAMVACATNQTDLDGSELGVFFEALLPQLVTGTSGAQVMQATRLKLRKSAPFQQPQFAINPMLPPFVAEIDEASPSTIAEVLLGATAGASATSLQAVARFVGFDGSHTVAIEWLRRGLFKRALLLLTHLTIDSAAVACGVLSAARGLGGAVIGPATELLKARPAVTADVQLTSELADLAAPLLRGGTMSRLRAVLVGVDRPRKTGTRRAHDVRLGVDEVRDALVYGGVPESQIAVLTNKEASRDAILAALAAAASSSDHAVFVYWQGPGTTSALDCGDGTVLDERLVAATAGESVTLFTDGPDLGSRTPGETGVPRLTVLAPPRGKRSKAARGSGAASVGPHTQSLISALRTSEHPGGIAASSLGTVDAQPIVVVGPAGSDMLFPDPLGPRIDAVALGIRRAELRQTNSLVERLLERRNGADPEAQLQRGILHMNLGSVEEAIPALESAVAQFKGDNRGEARAHLELGRALMSVDRARAVSECHQATLRNPDLLDAQFWLGRAIAELIAQETTAQAVEALRRYVRGGAPIGRREEALELIAGMLAKTELPG